MRTVIVDAYTHIWESPAQLGRVAEQVTVRAARLRSVAACEAHENPGHEVGSPTPARHRAACERADRVIVVGFKSDLLAADIPNRYVADYVREHPDKLIGLAGLDPAHPEAAVADLEEARELGLHGAAIAPAAQGFHPASSGAYRLYERLEQAGMPVLIHHGLYLCDLHRLEYARPVLLDEIARDFPNLRLLIAHLGSPWTDEAIALLAKHPNVFAEISGLLTRPWRAYNALLNAYQYGVLDKLVFASGWPMSTTERALESLYRVGRICQGTSLPVVPREQLRRIVEHRTLELLGLPDLAPPRSAAPPPMMVTDPDA